MNIIRFGDSNTYGYDPRGDFGWRYDADSRWVDILAAESGWTVYNMGQNGREISAAAPPFPVVLLAPSRNSHFGCSRNHQFELR